ncbi:tRNA(adenine34) deaminase [Neonectria punicea]|uniref:tRNA(Adenine34) deaminase n=1 Tax=Neonectria punicea TaxID=979145 RepID=A0ABR1GXN2_9HYPO
MGMLKKAGSATSRAFRRLFGHASPAGDGDGAAGSTGSLSTGQNIDSDHREPSIHNNKSNSSNNDDDANNASNHIDGTPPRTTRDKAQASSTENQQSTHFSTSSPPNVKKTPTNPEGKPKTRTTEPESDTMAYQRQQVRPQHIGKENLPPKPDAVTDNLSDTLASLTLGESAVTPVVKPVLPVLPILPPSLQDPTVVAERAMHMRFTEDALDMARLALKTNETPVGCVIVHNGKVIARGMNATNVTRNGTRHAEFMALSALLSLPPKTGPLTTCLKPKVESSASTENSDASSTSSHSPDEGNEDGSKGHLYPYGQKWHPAPRVDRSIIRESILYVTVEPCVMCASLLRQLGIKKVYFGAVNDKFGGTGGVFSIHANSLPVRPDGQTASAHPTPRPTQLPDGTGTLGVSFPPGGGDGGNIESGYEIEGGWGRDEAVALLRRFYVQENGRAPVPRKKEGRAARLAAMMEKDGDSLQEGDGNDSPLDAEPADLIPTPDVLKEQVNIANGRTMAESGDAASN